MQKITYEKATESNSSVYAMKKNAAFKFNIVGSILKSHYKTLAKMSFLFNSAVRNEGYILPDNEAHFLELLVKINESNDKRCKTSHAKARQKYASRSVVATCEHADLGSLGYVHGEFVKCPQCGENAEVW